MKKGFIYFILMFLILSNIIIVVYDYLNKDNSYIILNEKNIWSIKDQTIKKISKTKLKKLNYSTSKLYDKEEIDGYITISNGLKFYDTTLSEKNLQDGLIVVGNKKIKNYTYLISTKIDKEEIKNINKYFLENNIDFDESEVIIKKINLSDNRLLYDIQSLSAEMTGKNGYSVILLKEDDEITAIYENFELVSRSSSLDKVIDINNDGKEDLILLSDIHGSANNECYSLYIYNNKNTSFDPVINCEEE